MFTLLDDKLTSLKTKIENEHDQRILSDVGGDANKPESTEPFSEIPHSGRDPKVQKDPGDCQAIE